jgi:hypothetical protein
MVQPKPAARPVPRPETAQHATAARTNPPAGTTRPNAAQPRPAAQATPREPDTKHLHIRSATPTGAAAASDLAAIEAQRAAARDALLTRAVRAAMRPQAR